MDQWWEAKARGAVVRGGCIREKERGGGTVAILEGNHQRCVTGTILKLEVNAVSVKEGR